jgi:hypothetical protein
MKNEWNLIRFIASSRVMLIICLPIIMLALLFKLSEKSKFKFLLLSFLLLGYLWLNIIVVLIRAFDNTFKGGIKIRKVILLFLMSVLIYSLVYYAIDNYYNNAFYESDEYKKDKNIKDHPILKYFDMIFFTSNIMATLGYNVDITPRNRIIKVVVIGQCFTSIFLLVVLFSRIV